MIPIDQEIVHDTDHEYFNSVLLIHLKGSIATWSLHRYLNNYCNVAFCNDLITRIRIFIAHFECRNPRRVPILVVCNNKKNQKLGTYFKF